MNPHEIDSETFGRLIEPYRHELQIHCYRMMGSIEEAEEMVQETFIRAWTRIHSLKNPDAFRSWLYKIATNICLDALKIRSRRVIPRTRQDVSYVDAPIPSEVADPIWLQPYPDELLPRDMDSNLDVVLVRKEQISLAFIAVIHLLPPRQRAVLLLSDVLEWKAREIASLMETSVSAVKSALYRARRTLDENQAVLTDGQDNIAVDEELQSRLEEYVEAWQSANVSDLMRLLTEDATFSMPPTPSWYRGRDEIRALVSKTIFRGSADARWHLMPTHANNQIAFGLYRIDDKTKAYEFYGIQVLSYKQLQISDILTFRNISLYHYFNLPRSIPIET